MAKEMICKSCGAHLDSSTGGVCGACLLGDVILEQGENPIAGYELGEELGRGGSSIVYRAWHPATKRDVAVKVLKVSWMDGQGLRDRFRLEAQTLAQLQHPGILPLYEFGEADGVPWYSMMQAAGGTLAERVTVYRGKWREIAELMKEVADAVWHAHERGVLHRDLKPGNLLFGEDGRVFVSDFGLARVVSTPSDVTVTAAVLGTPAYLAPEIITSGVASATTGSDVWGLGVILYELLSGQRPFRGESVPELVAQITSETPPVPAGPRDLQAITMKALRRDPSKRYASVLEFRRDLQAWLDGAPVEARPYGWRERAWYTAKRHPALATALLFSLAAVGGVSWAALREMSLRKQAELARARAETAEAATKQQLRAALVAEARTLVKSGVQGQRFDVLHNLQHAAKLEAGRDLRDLAIQALSKPDFDVRRTVAPESWGLSSTLAFDTERRRAWFRDEEGMSLRSVEDGKVLASFPLPKGLEVLYTHSLSANGLFGVCATEDNVLHVWSFESGKEVLKLVDFPPVEDAGFPYQRDAIFSPDGYHLAVGDKKGGLSLYDLRTGTVVVRREGICERAINRIVFEEDGKRLWVNAIREVKGRLLCLSADTLETIQEINLGDKAVIHTFEVSRAHDRVVVGGESSFSVLQLSNGENLYTVAGLDFPVKFAWIHADGKYLELWQNGTTLETRDLRTGRLLLSTATKGLNPPQPDASRQRWLYANLSSREPLSEYVFSEGQLSRYFELLPQLKGSAPGNLLQFNRDGTLIAASSTNSFGVWSVASGKPVAERHVPGGIDDKWLAIFSPTEEVLYVSSHALGLRRFPLEKRPKGEVTLGEPTLVDGTPGYLLLALSPDGKRALLGRNTTDGMYAPGLQPESNDPAGVRCVELADGKTLWSWKGAKIWSAVWSGDLKHVYLSQSTETEPNNHLLNAETGEVLSSGLGPFFCLLPDPERWPTRGVTEKGKVGSYDWKKAVFTQDLPKELDTNYFMYLPVTERLSMASGFSDPCFLDGNREVLLSLSNPHHSTSLVVLSMAVSPNKDQLAVFDAMGGITVWDLKLLSRHLEELGLLPEALAGVTSGSGKR